LSHNKQLWSIANPNSTGPSIPPTNNIKMVSYRRGIVILSSAYWTTVRKNSFESSLAI